MTAELHGGMICSGCASTVALVTSQCPSCGDDPLLAGRYSLVEVLGHGGMGTTYRARCVVSGRVVAVKEFPLRASDAPKKRELFLREAQVLRQLHHPAIPRWLDQFEAGRGKHRALYLIREFVEGRDLAREMLEHRYSSAEVLDIVDELLGLLSYLHSLSPPIIHRDLKPANVLRRTVDGRLMLVDFGAVRDVVQDSDLGGSTITGTFGYMAPEQFRGDAVPATDLYGVGALAVCLLTRREPHTLLGNTGRLEWQAHTRVDPVLGTLLNRLLESDPEKRPTNAAHVRRWINSVRRAPPHVPLPPIPGPMGPPAGRPHAAPLAITGPRAPVRAPGRALATRPALPDAVPFVGMAVGVATSLGVLAMLLAMLMTVLGLLLL